MRIRPTVGDLSGAVGDLGVMVPLVAALVLVNGLDAGAVLIVAGALVVFAGVVFRVPFPVQPLKALTALAVAQGMSADMIHMAGLEIGIILVLLAATGLASWLARLFTVPVIRSLQFAVGALLVVTAVRLILDPPAIFENPPTRLWTVILAGATLAIVVVAAATHRYFLVGGLFLIGIVVGVAAADVDFGIVALQLPGWDVPEWSVAGSAFVLLVVPQIPLTYGNAVVGVSHLAREQFGAEARRVTPNRVALSCGIGNVVSAVVGGMPMCHGSSGFTAHIRLGARTAAMNVTLGSAFLLLGLVFSQQVLVLFGLLPVWALGGFLAYAGVRHAMMILDLRGLRLGIALVAGLTGVATGNLALTTVVALTAEHLPGVIGRRRRQQESISEPAGGSPS